MRGQVAYSACAITHLDCFRLERDDFTKVMRAHPAGAIHVADSVRAILPEKAVRKVLNEIYESSGEMQSPPPRYNLTP